MRARGTTGDDAMRPAGTRNSGRRYNADTGEFELRCEDCAARGVARYWPAALEFWQPNWGMNRCRACWMERKAARNRVRWATDPAFRQRKLEENREQRRAQARFAYRERWAALRSDPEKYEQYVARRRELQRTASARYRARQRELQEAA